MSAALDRLRALYADPVRAVDEARAKGRPVVGLVGCTVPPELVLAAGCVPVTLTGRNGDTSTGDRYMEPIFEPELRLIFQCLLDGGYGRLDLLIVPRASDQYNKFYLYLREVERLGDGAALPPIELYDLLHAQTPLNRAYGLERTRELAALLAEIGGADVDAASVGVATRAMNRLRMALRDFQALREAGRLPLTNVDALQVLGARRFDCGPDTVEAIEAVNRTALPAARNGPRVLVKGFPLNQPELHAAFDALGVQIVAEDDWWGARAAEDHVPEEGDSIEAVFEAVYRKGFSIRTEPRAARDAWFEHKLATLQLDGVLFYIPPFDDVLGWDFPHHRALAERAGRKVLRIDDDVAAITPDHLRPFVESLRS